MKRLRILGKYACAATAWVVILGTTSWSQPADPSDLEVFPRYTSPIVLVAQWQDNSNNEDGFRIERREEGTATWTFWTTIAAFAGTGQREWIDNTASSSKRWEYRVCATGPTPPGNSGFTNVSHGTSPKQVWPIDDGDHDILNNFGNAMESVVAGNFYFHAGVDISAGGKQLNAGRGGIVTSTDAGAGGQLWLDVDFGTGPETDVYAHVDVDAAWGAGDPIAPGERIGTVRDDYFGRSDEADHVHWGNGHMNNLIPYDLDADRDPNASSPRVWDMDGDGRDFIVVDAAANDHASPRDPAWGDVDFLVDAYDDMTHSFNINVAPFRIGYWIQSWVAGGENVRTGASPYRLIEFDYQLTGPGPAGPIELACVYWDLPGDLHGIDTWQNFFTWIVTNTRGTDGSTANVDAAEFWRTDARKGTGTQPNGSDAQRARENQEARFPDGTYYVHIMLEDLVHQSDRVRSAVVDNSRPYVKRVTVSSGIQPVYQALWSWDAAIAQLELQPATFDAAAAFSALRTQDVNIEVEFSEPMGTASVVSVLPLGVAPTLASVQMPGQRTVWRGTISNLDIADDGSDDGIQMITFDGTDLAGNSLLQIHDRASMGADNHNRDAVGGMRGAAGTDNIHGFRIGPLSGVLNVAAIYMKRTVADPATPVISNRTAEIQQALNTYFADVSYAHVSFAVSGHGWYQLAQNIDWYYTTPQTPLIDLVQEAIAAAESDGVDLSTTNYILVVTDDDDATHEEWSTNGGWPYAVSAAPGWRLMASGTMRAGASDARITNLGGRWVGLIDLFEYPYVITPRQFVGPWSHMSDKDDMVQVMGWEKWRAGWLDETGTATGKTLVRVAKPPVASPIVDQAHTLLPLDDAGDGQKMVAIEAGDRLHYTAEYRRQQNLDGTLPDEGVLIVKANDCVSQGEGPAIVQESSTTAGNLDDATFTLDAARKVFDDAGSGINIEVTSINANEAEIQLNYEVPPTQNDVYVSPHNDRWKAEDIWIDAPDLEGNFETDPLTVKDANEKPVVGSVNRVYGRVRNQGHADAMNFEVQLGIRTPWGAGGPWISLNIETVTLLQGQDHASDAYYIITGEWTPASGEHSCVQITVTGVANDVNTENNWTQENIFEFATSPGSPYAPVTSRFEVENPYSETLPVFFKVDGLPESWSYILSPERLVVPSMEVGTAQITIQPNEAAPLCSSEQVTISAYVPQVDALKRLGAITLQIALKNEGNIRQKSWMDCGKTAYIKTKGVAAVAVAEAPMNDVDAKYIAAQPTSRCVVYSRGCTEPPLANTEVAVVYTAPDGTKTVHYVTTDADGCYLDMISAGEPGEWEVQAVLPEAPCQMGDRTPPQVIVVDDSVAGFRGPWQYFTAFGPNFPLGDFDEQYDPGFSLNFGAERSLRTNLMLVGLIGFHQFYSPVQNQHFVQGSVNAKHVYYRTPARFAYVNVGPGVYIPRYGTTAWGFNIGTGLTWMVGPNLGVDLNIDYHFVDYSGKYVRRAVFADIQMGVVWSY